MLLAPPANATFASLELAWKELHAHASIEGYEVKSGRSRTIGNKKGGTIKHVVVHCVHGGAHKVKDHQVRNTSTSRTGCPFQTTLRRNEADGSFTLTIDNSEHNHAASEDVAAYAAARTLSSKQLLTVKQLCKAGVQPKAMLTTLRQTDLYCKAILQDIYNIKTKAKNSFLAGRLPLEALLDMLIEKNVTHNLQRDASGKLIHLFIVPDSTVAIAKENSANDVHLLDSTYKTNKYRMPLLHIMGVTATNQSFSLAYCFMAAETEADYFWVVTQLSNVIQPLNRSNAMVFVTDRELALMNAIRRVFPTAYNLLCIWHINKNVLANLKNHFATADGWEDFMGNWYSLCNAATQPDFDDEWQAMQAKHQSIVTSYLEETWLSHKEKFIKAWTRHNPHYNLLVTSRVEGGHATMKGWISVSTGDLETVYDKITLHHTQQKAQISRDTAFQKARVQLRHQSGFWSDVVKKISYEALKEAFDRYQLARSLPADAPACTGSYTVIMGIPCSHSIKRMLVNEQKPRMSDFRQHWWLQQTPLAMANTAPTDSLDNIMSNIAERHKNLAPHQQPIFRRMLTETVKRDRLTAVDNPAIICGRGRPNRSANRTSEDSTRRDPSAFEYVNAEGAALSMAARRKRTCGECHEEGHNIRTCPVRRQRLL